MVSQLLCSLCMKALHASNTCSYLHCIYSGHVILVSLFRGVDRTLEPPLALGLASHLHVLVTKRICRIDHFTSLHLNFAHYL